MPRGGAESLADGVGVAFAAKATAAPVKAAAPSVAAATMAAILDFVISFPPSREPSAQACLACHVSAHSHPVGRL
jgi:hypothetical protein